MSIALDFRPRQNWDRMFSEAEAANLTDFELSMEALPADLIFIVDGTDISWFAEIPMLDFAASLFVAAHTLSSTDTRERFISPDLAPWWTLEFINGDSVRISRQGLQAQAFCELAELRIASARFGIRVYETFVKAYPSALTSNTLREWYPLDSMKLALLSLDI